MNELVRSLAKRLEWDLRFRLRFDSYQLLRYFYLLIGGNNCIFTLSSKFENFGRERLNEYVAFISKRVPFANIYLLQARQMCKGYTSLLRKMNSFVNNYIYIYSVLDTHKLMCPIILRYFINDVFDISLFLLMVF